jgi:endonuclease-3
MSAMSVADILSIIRPLGLAPQKAAALSKMSKILTERFEGRVPRSFEELESLPGVGHKTASVVMAQAFGVPAFPVDTHIFRMAQIWRLSRAQSIAQVERDLKKCFPESRWNKLHLQIIFYGRRYCRARQCKGPECPLYSKLFPGRRTTPTYRRSP